MGVYSMFPLLMSRHGRLDLFHGGGSGTSRRPVCRQHARGGGRVDTGHWVLTSLSDLAPSTTSLTVDTAEQIASHIYNSSTICGCICIFFTRG